MVLEVDVIKKRRLSILLRCKNVLRLHRIEAWNDVMKVTRLETLFISVNKNFKKVARCKVHTS